MQIFLPPHQDTPEACVGAGDPAVNQQVQGGGVAGVTLLLNLPDSSLSCPAESEEPGLCGGEEAAEAVAT